MRLAGMRQWLITPHPSISARLARWCLRLLSLPYAAAVVVRNWAYDQGLLRSRRLNIPVICIGNLTVGGTGKTPAVAWLAAYLRARGVRVAIVSRGYGELEGGRNDEALELELRLPDVPHLQNPDRYAAGLLAQDELEMEAIVLDDGFQHRRLARDLDIVIIDATDPPAAHWLLPGGLLREPLSGLRRAGIVLISRAQLAEEKNLARIERLVDRYAPQALCVRTWHATRGLRSTSGSTQSLDAWAGRPVLAFCGIGNPPPFFQALRNHGLQLVGERTWPDHHAYSANDVAELSAWASEHASCAGIICTMKDWVKLQVPRLGALPLLALEIELVIDPNQLAALEHRLLAALSGQRP